MPPLTRFSRCPSNFMISTIFSKICKHLGLVWMYSNSHQSTCVKVDWSWIWTKFHPNPLQHMWIEVNPITSKQGFIWIYVCLLINGPQYTDAVMYRLFFEVLCYRSSTRVFFQRSFNPIMAPKKHTLWHVNDKLWLGIHCNQLEDHRMVSYMREISHYDLACCLLNSAYSLLFQEKLKRSNKASHFDWPTHNGMLALADEFFYSSTVVFSLYLEIII